MPNRAATLPSAFDVDPRLANTLWQWLGLGLLAVALVPAARGQSALIGYLPFWLVLAPASALLAVHRHALAAAWRAHLVRATPRRRRRSARVQASPRPRSARPTMTLYLRAPQRGPC
jgi:hypothetical protein